MFSIRAFTIYCLASLQKLIKDWSLSSAQSKDSSWGIPLVKYKVKSLNYKGTREFANLGSGCWEKSCELLFKIVNTAASTIWQSCSLLLISTASILCKFLTFRSCNAAEYAANNAALSLSLTLCFYSFTISSVSTKNLTHII